MSNFAEHPSLPRTLESVGDGRVGGELRSPGAHDALLGRIATELLGWSTWAHLWIPSDEADVFELTADDEPPRIVKVEREGMWCVRREERAFPVLRSRGFVEFPEVEFATESLEEPSASFTVMPETEWRPWSDLWDEDRALCIWVVERIGDFLRRLAAVDWRDIPGVVTPDARVEGFAAWFDDFFAPLMRDPSLSVKDRARLEEVLEAMREPPEAFGGWQFAQALTDGRSTFTAIDWGNLGAYWPLHDLAAAICSLDKFGADAPRFLRPYLLDAFTAGFEMEADDDVVLDRWLDLWSYFGRAASLRANAG